MSWLIVAESYFQAQKNSSELINLQTPVIIWCPSLWIARAFFKKKKAYFFLFLNLCVTVCLSVCCVSCVNVRAGVSVPGEVRLPQRWMDTEPSLQPQLRYSKIIVCLEPSLEQTLRLGLGYSHCMWEWRAFTLGDRAGLTETAWVGMARRTERCSSHSYILLVM